ncbi:MAG: hypothetical protein KI790_05625 [Cyclobacteriaceae bacterium]|nr:hypothetical protein [Cyclobacteriaceae bacterium HetDA_MAG_MS6]
MNIENLNQAFIEIAEKKIELQQFDYEDPHYGVLEEGIRQLENRFTEQYGPFIEDALFNVHDEYCPDNDVLYPAAYIASQYLKTDNYQYDVEKDQGIRVEADDFPGVKARLVLVPAPTRLVLQGEQKEFRETVWIAR